MALNKRVIEFIIREQRHWTKSIVEAREKRCGELVSVPAEGREIPVFYHRAPLEGKAPAMFYFHSGANTFGGADECDGLCEKLAKGLGASVFAVEYRLCPETRYPGGVMDCCESVKYFYEHAEEYSLDRERFIVAGGSAGAGHACVSCYLAEELGYPKPRLAVLLCPYLDSDLDPHERPPIEGGSINPDVMEGMISIFAPDELRGSPILSPLRAGDELLGKMPPTVIVAAQLDSMIYDAEAFRNKLRARDIPVWYKVFKGAGHMFMEFGGDPDTYMRMQEDMRKFCRSEAFPQMTDDMITYLAGILRASGLSGRADE